MRLHLSRQWYDFIQKFRPVSYGYSFENLLALLHDHAPAKVDAVARDCARRRPRATPVPGLPAQPTSPEERIGVVTHYYSHLSVATMRLESSTLRVGDVIRIHGHTTDFSQRVESLEVNHAPANEVGPNDDFGLKVVDHAREHDVVYKVRATR